MACTTQQQNEGQWLSSDILDATPRSFTGSFWVLLQEGVVEVVGGFDLSSSSSSFSSSSSWSSSSSSSSSSYSSSSSSSFSSSSYSSSSSSLISSQSESSSSSSSQSGSSTSSSSTSSSSDSSPVSSSSSSVLSSQTNSSSSNSGFTYLTSLDANLYGYWSLDEGADPWIDVISGNNLHVTSGAPTGAAAQHNDGLQFSVGAGAGSAVEAAAASNTPMTGGCAVSFWDMGGTSAGLVSFGGCIYVLRGGGVTSVFVTQSDLSQVVISHAGTGHIVAVAANGNVHLYINGNLRGSTTFDDTFATSSVTKLAVVASSSPSTWLVDEVAYWKDISFSSFGRQQQFVNTLYNHGTGLFYSGGVWS